MNAPHIRHEGLSPVATLNRLAPGSAAVFLDFDGTLVDLAETPDGIVVPPELLSLLADLHDATGGRLALVSGRATADLSAHVAPFSGRIVGGHGAEDLLDGQTRALSGISADEVAAMTEAAQAAVADCPELLLERKATGAVLHYRRAPDLRARVEDIAADLAQRWPGFELHHAKMAVELRPDGASKDRAIAEILQEPTYAGRTPVFAGDDTTDEPALGLVAERGGIAIKVGEGPSRAPFRLADPGEMIAVLADWLDTSRKATS